MISTWLERGGGFFKLESKNDFMSRLTFKEALPSIRAWISKANCKAKKLLSAMRWEVALVLVELPSWMGGADAVTALLDLRAKLAAKKKDAAVALVGMESRLLHDDAAKAVLCLRISGVYHPPFQSTIVWETKG